MTTTDEQPKRQTVQVNADAAPILEKLNDETGISKGELVSRILLWLDRQPKSVRREMLERNGDVAGELVRIRDAELQAVSLADKPEAVARLTREQTARLARSLIDRLSDMAAAVGEVAKARGKSKGA